MKDFSELIEETLQSIKYCDVIFELTGKKQTNLTIENSEGTYYLKYDCPCLGYRELLLPVFCENKYLIGVLFVGELILVEKKLSNFYSTEQLIFVEHLKQYYHYKDDHKLLRKLRNAKLLKPDEKYLSNEEYEKKVQSISKRVKRLEKRIDEELDRMRVKFINQKFNEYNNQLLKITTNLRNDTIDLSIFWSQINKVIIDILNDFKLDDICIISHNSLKIKYSTDFQFAYNHSDENCTIKENIKDYLNKIEKQTFDKLDERSINNLILKNIEPDVKREHIKLYSVNPENNTFIIIYFRYSDCWKIIIDKAKDSINTFYNNLDTLFYIISTKLSTILANYNSKINIDTLKIYGHEMAQFFSGIKSINDYYLRTSGSRKHPLILSKKDDQIADISKNLHDYLIQILATNNRSKYLIELPVLSKSEFLPYKELIYIWYSTSQNQLIKEKKRIIIDEPDNDDPSRPKIWADKEQMQHVFYNIITNAIKYSYRGTNIYIDGKLEDDEYVFTIESYGIPVPPKTTIDNYALYAQSNEAINSGNKGLGIGLYISQNIVKAHSGIIEHTSNEISRYNIPLAWKLNINSDEIDLTNKKEILKEFYRLTLDGTAQKIVFLDSEKRNIFKPSKDEIVNEINKPTYKNIFYIRLPQTKEL